MTTPIRFRREIVEGRARVERLTARAVARDLVAWSVPLPRAPAIAYAADLTRRQRALNLQIWLALQPLITQVGAEARQDAAEPQDPISTTFRVITDAVTKILSATVIRSIVTPHGRSILRFNERKYANTTGEVNDVSARSLKPLVFRSDAATGDVLKINDISASRTAAALESWVEENVTLIQGANADQIRDLKALMLRSQRQGLRASAIQADVRKILGSTVKRARLIARDQTTKFSGQLDRIKQTSAGITSYIWRTSQDERVRPTHRDLNGRRFTWARPPAVGAPGQPVQCRCVAEPDIGALLGAAPEGERPSASVFLPETPASRRASRIRHMADIAREQDNIRAVRARVNAARRERRQARLELDALAL